MALKHIHVMRTHQRMFFVCLMALVIASAADLLALTALSDDEGEVAAAATSAGKRQRATIARAGQALTPRGCVSGLFV